MRVLFYIGVADFGLEVAFKWLFRILIRDVNIDLILIVFVNGRIWTLNKYGDLLDKFEIVSKDIVQVF